MWTHHSGDNGKGRAALTHDHNFHHSKKWGWSPPAGEAELMDHKATGATPYPAHCLRGF